MTREEHEALAILEDVLPKAVDVRDAADAVRETFDDPTTGRGLAAHMVWCRAEQTVASLDRLKAMLAP